MHFQSDLVAPTLYVARRLELPPRTAIAAFDAYRTENRSIVSDIVELQLAVSTTGGVPAAPHGRHVLGRLRRVGRRFGIPVEVEVTPWSRSSSEIGIRPAGRGVPIEDCGRQRRYLMAALQIADALATTLEQRVLAQQAAAIGIHLSRSTDVRTQGVARLR